MLFSLVDSGWWKILDRELAADHQSVRIVCPFIKRKTIERMLESRKPKSIRVITRFNLNEFCVGVNDISPLQLLMDRGAEIRGIKHLHAKLYLFGSVSSIVASANLTDSALSRNHEFGFVASDPNIAQQCRSYFDRLWTEAKRNASARDFEKWSERIERFKLKNRSGDKSNLGDLGEDLGIPPDDSDISSTSPDGGHQAFIKFLGEGHNRARDTFPILNVVRQSECHWAVAYPKDKRPRGLGNGAIVYLGRLVAGDPPDTLIFGRAVGQKHRPGVDDASPAEIKRLDWKKKWPHYVRLSEAEFVAGALSNGVSLNQLMRELGSRSFASTLRNSKKRRGNTDPRKAYMQQAAVELSPAGAAWLDSRLSRALRVHGQISAKVLENLPGPSPS